MLNIVVPMAGAGSRFAKAGFSMPKPLIPIHDVPMIQLVIANLRPLCPHRFIFVCQQSHMTQYDLKNRLSQWVEDPIIVVLDGLTEGAACTVLAAEAWINNDEPLMIANSDQYVETSIDDYLNAFTERSLDGLIMTMTASDPKWSFVEMDEDAYVTRVVEKEVISNDATVGIYSFSRGASFVQMAKAMIQANERVNHEFYVAPVYNRLIATGAKIGVFDIGLVESAMHGLGTPEDLSLFLAKPIARQAVENII